MDSEQDELQKEVCDAIMPSILKRLICNGVITQQSNKSDIIKALSKEGLIQETLNSLYVRTTISGEFEESIEEALSNKRFYVALIMAGTCIEHILNELYYEILSNKYSLEQSETDAALRSLNIRDKCTWFFKIIANEEMNEELVANILSINSIRNSVVHYKDHAQTFEEWCDEDVNIMRLINNNKSLLTSLPSIISELKNHCEQTILDLIPDSKNAMEAYEKLKN